MNADPASLERLHDIVAPPPAPWWPPAPGWLWLLAILGVLVALALLRGLIHWQRNRYRREALAELRHLEHSAGEGNTEALLLALSTLLKRVALTAYDRERVAGLTGTAWFAFLDRTGGTTFGEGLGQALASANYRECDAGWDANTTRALIAEVRTWIRCHTPVEANAGAAPTDAAGPSRP